MKDHLAVLTIALLSGGGCRSQEETGGGGAPVDGARAVAPAEVRSMPAVPPVLPAESAARAKALEVLRAQTSRDVESKACVLAEPDGSGVVLWPTIAGLDAYLRVLEDPNASGRVRFQTRGANGAFGVDTGAKCEIVASVPLGAKVRVLTGNQRGKVGWVPHAWRLGK